MLSALKITELRLPAWEHLEGYRVGQQILIEVCQAVGADGLEGCSSLLYCMGSRLLSVYQLYVSI